ncbi:hypothetical protein ACQPVP_06945 [Clostridium nigeriense]|uniref:hypothetical protein n=1 Tax=Clostridium nigeriense TaxID=1805470 RepID=UPI003D3474D9
MDLKIINQMEFENIIKVKFNNILDGFDNYDCIELYSNKNNKKEAELNFIKSIEMFFDLNEGFLIIDFYKNNLNNENINFIKRNLDNEDIKIFDKLLKLMNEQNIYYKIENKKYINLLTKLCTRELFFITFYFYKFHCTIWGNYNMRFPLFYNYFDDINDYLNIAKINDLL